MKYDCQSDNSQSKSQFVKINHYRSKYGHQHRALVHTEKQAIKGPKMTSVKSFQQDNHQPYLYQKRENINTYESHHQTTATEHTELN